MRPSNVINFHVVLELHFGYRGGACLGWKNSLKYVRKRTFSKFVQIFEKFRSEVQIFENLIKITNKSLPLLIISTCTTHTTQVFGSSWCFFTIVYFYCNSECLRTSMYRTRLYTYTRMHFCVVYAFAVYRNRVT